MLPSEHVQRTSGSCALYQNPGRRFRVVSLVAVVASSWMVSATIPTSSQDVRPQTFTVAYELGVSTDRNQRLTVRITVPRTDATSLAFEIPAWTPGYYQILH